MKNDELCKLVSTIDHRLFDIQNKISEIEFQNDYYSKSLDSDNLKREILAIYMSEDLRSITENHAIAVNNPELYSKIETLKQEMHHVLVENDPDVLSSKQSIDELFHDFNYMDHYSVLLHSENHGDRQAALQRIESQCTRTNQACVNLIHILNLLSRRQGYSSYPALKLKTEGLSIPMLEQFFLKIHYQILPEWKQMLHAYHKETHQQPKNEDLYFMVNSFCRFTEKSYTLKEPLVFLDHFLTSMKVPLGNLPITIQTASLPFCGACYRVYPNKDVRVLINSNQPAMFQFSYGLHEIGHALYYCHCPENSELLLDHHLSREIMADIWTQFLNQPEFYVRYMSFSAPEAQELVYSTSLKKKLNLMILIRDAMFILEAFQNEYESLSEIWKKVNKDWLCLDIQDSAYELFDFLNPLDLKSYVFSEVLSDRVFGEIFSQTGFTGKFYPILTSEYYSPGSKIDWKDKLLFQDSLK